MLERAVAILFLVVLVGLLFDPLGLFKPDPVEVIGGERAQPIGRAIAALDPGQIASVLPRDAIPAIVDPPMEPAGDVAGELEPDDLVIGVALGGDARAYPIRILSAHEIVDDRIRGKPIAVTW